MLVKFIRTEGDYIRVSVDGVERTFLLHGHDESVMKTFFIDGEEEVLMYFDVIDQSVGTI